jgi:hypothetical protein
MTALPKGYYESVKGINWISGYACQKILDRGPAVGMFYMGIKQKPSIIYDVAYSPEETIKIGLMVAKNMHIATTDITTGSLSENTAASLWYIVQKNYPKPIVTKIYKIEIPFSPGNAETFEEWCQRVKGRLWHKGAEKIEWYLEWKGAGH